MEVAMRVQMFRTTIAGCLMALAVLFAAPGSAQAQDAAQLKGIVEKQIAAFRAGDARRLRLCRPTIKRLFRPRPFYRHGEARIRPVYNPSSVAFGNLRDTARGPVQEVFVTDAKGQQWLALYSFEQQEDGSWKISGCVLTKAPARRPDTDGDLEKGCKTAGWATVAEALSACLPHWDPGGTRDTREEARLSARAWLRSLYFLG
ncbi:MAG: DUF4864 domain-containing protein [Alphaproteobacteria bacterium]|nr:DUF4864 domain-containing protein [Alphaproteobacteria bacterium]